MNRRALARGRAVDACGRDDVVQYDWDAAGAPVLVCTRGARPTGEV